jgi:hypothetical protein
MGDGTMGRTQKIEEENKNRVAKDYVLSRFGSRADCPVKSKSTDLLRQRTETRLTGIIQKNA